MCTDTLYCIEMVTTLFASETFETTPNLAQWGQVMSEISFFIVNIQL